MKRVLIVLTLASITWMPAQAQVILGTTAESFAVLAGSTVTNTGSSVITGNVGVSPGSAITGFPPGGVTGGSIYSGGATAALAESQTLSAYNSLAGEGVTTDLSGQNLGGMVLTPGVYHFSSAAQLTGTLTLNAEGQTSPRFDFQIGDTLTTANSASVVFINGGSGDTVYWQVGSSATLGGGTAFLGNVLALTSVTAVTGATDLSGRLLAINGAVTLDTNTIAIPTVTSTPEPTGIAILGSVLFAGFGILTMRRKARRI